METEGKLPGEEIFDVLLVEPDEPLLEDITDFLEDKSEQLNVQSVSSPDNGLDLIRDSDFDAVVSEISFSDYDSLEYLERIKESQPDLPVLFFTNETDEEIILESLNRDVDYYLLKESDTTSNLEELINALSAVIREKWENEKEESLHADLRHDIRNKLQIVQGYLELMEDDELTEDQEEFLDKSIDNLKEGAELIEEVRDFRKRNF